MAASIEPTTTMENEEIHEDAPEEWLCGAIGLSLRRAMEAQQTSPELLPVPPPGSPPSSAPSCRSRARFRDDRTDISAALDAIADSVFGAATAPASLRVPAAPASARPDSAASRRKACDHSSNSTAAAIVGPEAAIAQPPMMPAAPPSAPQPDHATKFRLYCRRGSGKRLLAAASDVALDER